VDVLLHTVASLSLEAVVSLAAIDKHVATNDTHGRSTCEHIEQCGFACA
jgi:hypothetical protein